MSRDDIKIGGAAVKIEDGTSEPWYARVRGRDPGAISGEIELKVRQFIFLEDARGRLIFNEDHR